MLQCVSKLLIDSVLNDLRVGKNPHPQIQEAAGIQCVADAEVDYRLSPKSLRNFSTSLDGQSVSGSSSPMKNRRTLGS